LPIVYLSDQGPGSDFAADRRLAAETKVGQTCPRPD